MVHMAAPHPVDMRESAPTRQVDPVVVGLGPAGADLITVHVEPEAKHDVPATLKKIRAAGRRVGLTFNPATPFSSVEPFLEQIDLLLVMTVHPGFGGQAFIAEVLPKLRDLDAEIERRGLRLPIGVDGGVNAETIEAAHAAGGEVLVVGSSLYRTPGDLAPNVSDLRARATSAAGGPPPQ